MVGTAVLVHIQGLRVGAGIRRHHASDRKIYLGVIACVGYFTWHIIPGSHKYTTSSVSLTGSNQCEAWQKAV